MGMTMRVSLPGFNALTDGTVDHYALYSDQDNILIKEFTRGNIIVGPSSFATVTHGLGYVPTVMAYGSANRTGVGVIDPEWIYGEGIYADLSMRLTSTNVVFRNSNSGTSGTANFQYYIFYDNI